MNTHPTPADPTLRPPQAAQRVHALGYLPMDRIHEELDGLLLRAQTVDDAGLESLLVEVDQHLQGHFAIEDRWMRDTQFPPRDCHMDEHAAVLDSCAGVLALAHAGNLAPARAFLAELARWFPGHADYLDSALAAWMFKREHGGKPVVLHRTR